MDGTWAPACHFITTTTTTTIAYTSLPTNQQEKDGSILPRMR